MTLPRRPANSNQEPAYLQLPKPQRRTEVPQPCVCCGSADGLGNNCHRYCNCNCHSNREQPQPRQQHLQLRPATATTTATTTGVCCTAQPGLRALEQLPTPQQQLPTLPQLTTPPCTPLHLNSLPHPTPYPTPRGGFDWGDQGNSHTGDFQNGNNFESP